MSGRVVAIKHSCVRCDKKLKHALVPVATNVPPARPPLVAVESVSVQFNGQTYHFCRMLCARRYFAVAG